MIYALRRSPALRLYVTLCVSVALPFVFLFLLS